MVKPRSIDMNDAEELDPSAQHWRNVLDHARKQAKHYRDIVAQAKVELENHWGASTGLVNGRPVLQRTTTVSKVLDTDRLRLKYPDVYQDCLKEVTRVSIYTLDGGEE